MERVLTDLAFSFMMQYKQVYAISGEATLLARMSLTAGRTLGDVVRRRLVAHVHLERAGLLVVVLIRISKLPHRRNGLSALRIGGNFGFLRLGGRLFRTDRGS